MKKLMITGVVTALLSLPALSAPQAAKASAPAERMKIEAAHQACEAQTKADAQGRPDRVAFDACMRAKGFEKPAGPPPCPCMPKGHRPEMKPHHAPPPPANASTPAAHGNIEAALKACSGQTDAQGRPDFAAFESCMQSKGFEKPAAPPPPPGEHCGPKGPPPQ